MGSGVDWERARCKDDSGDNADSDSCLSARSCTQHNRLGKQDQSLLHMTLQHLGQACRARREDPI